MSEEKVCPFRNDKESGFAPCYGQKCMAYYEYERFVLPDNVSGCHIQKTVRASGCYRMGAYTWNGGYAI